MPYRKIADHSKDCWYLLKGKANWVVEELQPLRRDSLGRANGRTSNRFLLVRCNCPNCPAKIIVLDAEVLAACKITKL